MNINELVVAITAHDNASVAIRAIAGVIGSLLTGALADAARASEETDAAIRGLAVAVNNAGGSWEQDGRAIESAIEQYEHLTGVSDSKLRPALANLINETGSVDDGLDRMAAALDLAAGAHVPLEQASRMVGRVSEENLNVFKRLGLNLDDVVRPGMSAAAKEAAVLAAVSERYGGAAAAAKKPTDDWTNAMADLQNNVGGALGPLRDYIALAPGISATFTAAGAVLAAFSTELGITRTGMMLTIPIAEGLQVAILPLLAGIAALGLAVGGGVMLGNFLADQAGFAPFGGGTPAAPRDFYLPGEPAGIPIVGSFASGGIVPGPLGAPGWAKVHGGERISSGDDGGGIHIHFHGTVSGAADFEDHVARALVNVKQRGGLRGVLA